MGSCFDCYVSLVSIYKWFVFTILGWISRSWKTCTKAPCDWWCLCCNKWLCWIALILIAIISVVIALIVEILIAVFCTAIALWCLGCNGICFIGCFGNAGCVANCLKTAPCGGPSVEIDWSPPSSSNSALNSSDSTSGITSNPGSSLGPGHSGTTTTPGTAPVPFVALPSMTITRVDELDELVRWRKIFILLEAVEVKIANITSEQTKYLQSKVNHYLFSCGCREGKYGIMFSLLLFTMYYRLFLLPVIFSWGELSIMIFSVIATGAILGKIVGLLVARLLLRRYVHHFKRSLQVR